MSANLQSEQAPDLNSIKRRFMNLNRQRLELTVDLLEDRQRMFIDALPLLFHENNEGLPGYLGEDTPSGICEYSVEKKSIAAAQSLFKDYEVCRRARRMMEIQGLYFMGSSGSIAFNRHSDFDVWLLHAASLSAERIDLIQQKAHAIEKWAEEELRLEVHFFIFSAEEFKQGKQQGLSSESSGSAQHYLLLDEFYRSSLLIAGKIPAWWLVPPGEERHYDEYLQGLIEQNVIDAEDYLDFGSVADIPPSEFFGAAVWQLYKSINSPYKSLMKLLLMEVYASEFPQILVLSMKFKESVYGGVKEINQLDPYVMMYQRIEEYLMAHNQSERLELFRQCFYIKINEPLGNQVRKKSWRRDLFSNMTLEWGWQQEQFLLMDTRKEWPIDEISQQRNRLMNALKESYRFLSTFARQNTEVSLVRQNDLNILGRKLYAAFEKKAGKIDIINRDNETSLNISTVTVQQRKSQSGQDVWQLFQYRRDNEDTQTRPIKRAQSVMEIIAWAYFNKIIDSHSAFSLFCNEELTVKELRAILQALEEEFPNRKLHEADFNDLSHPARIVHACLFVNVGHIPKIVAGESVSHVSSLRDNVLSYGAKHQNLAVSFDLLISTTWEELLTFHFDGEDALLECICEYTRWYPLANMHRPPQIHVFSYSSSYGPAITRRIEELFQDIIGNYYQRDVNDQQRYLVGIGDSFHEIYHDNGYFKHGLIGNNRNLLRSLARPHEYFCPLIFDKYTEDNKLLQAIYKLNRENRIQLFYKAQNNIARIYIIDENGSLFTQQIPYYDGKALIKHFDLFFQSCINRRLFLSLDSTYDVENIAIEFYAIHESKNRPFRITRVNNDIEDNYGGFFDVKVIGDPDDRQHSLSIFCEDMEFSLMEHGNQLFNVVAQYIVERRASGETYPIYITDIDVSHSMMEQIQANTLQTLHYLNYKKRIEDKLNKAISAM